MCGIWIGFIVISSSSCVVVDVVVVRSNSSSIRLWIKLLSGSHVHIIHPRLGIWKKTVLFEIVLACIIFPFFYGNVEANKTMKERIIIRTQKLQKDPRKYHELINVSVKHNKEMIKKVNTLAQNKTS